jgi:hypothetical protein
LPHPALQQALLRALTTKRSGTGVSSETMLSPAIVKSMNAIAAGSTS